MIRRFVVALLLLIPTVGLGQTRSPELSRAIPLVEAGKFTEARPLLDAALRARPTDAEAMYYQGRVAFEVGGAVKAGEWFDKAAAIQPNNSIYQMWIGRAYGLQARDASVFKQPFLAKKTQAAMEKAVALDETNLDARGDLIQYYLLAPGFMGGSVEKAQAQARAIKARDPKRGHLALAQIALNQKQLPVAEREYAAAIALAPTDVSLRIQLVSVYLTQAQYPKAWAALEQAVILAPENRNVQYQIGKAAALSGQQLDRGEAALKRYLTASPSAGDPPLSAARWRLGMLYEKRGNPAAARTEYQTALRLEPTHREAKAALARLNG